MTKVHPSSFVDERAQLGSNVEIGPLCVITGDVVLGDDVKLLSHVSIQGKARIGAGTLCYPGACLGFEPQDKKITPGTETAGIVIGESCVFREGATVHAASNTDKPTQVGDRCYFMVNAHAGHDTTVGNDVILVNGTALGGHAVVEDRANLSGSTMVHQFGRVGRCAMTSGCTALSNDLPPFFMAVERNLVVGLNLVGMRRSGMSREDIAAVKSVYSEVFRKNPPQSELREILAERAKQSQAVAVIAQFVKDSNRPLCQIGGRKVFRAVDTADA